jgi:hypothetical protein
LGIKAEKSKRYCNYFLESEFNQEDGKYDETQINPPLPGRRSMGCLSRLMTFLKPSRRHFVFTIAIVGLSTAVGAAVLANDQPASGSGYNVALLPANIAPTPATRTDPVEVFGQPRMTTGHPNAYWDQEDIDHYKEMLKTSTELQQLLATLKSTMDKRIAEPIDVPPPQKGPDGKWMFPGDYFPATALHGGKDTPIFRFKTMCQRDSEAVSDLGTLYALTGDEKYAEYARKLLLAYAHCSEWGVSPIYNVRSEIGMTGALLGEAFIMMGWARGYDLIYNSPSWTKEDRAQLHDDLFYPLALTVLYPAWPGTDTPWYACHRTNRSFFNCVSVLVAGCATDDQELVNAALYGIHPKGDFSKAGQFPPEKPWTAATADDPTYGLMTRYFAPDCIRGGMWVEPSLGYSLYTLSSMVGAAEILWHHNIDLYRHNNAIFKNMFDAPILFTYPDQTEPGMGSGRRSLFEYHASTIYEYGYRRYHDPRYLAVINGDAKPERTLRLSASGSCPPSILFDLDSKEAPTPGPKPSVNWPLVGPGVLRTPASDGKGLQQNLVLMSGPSASKSDPDKLNIELFALGDILMPSPGHNFPFHNTIVPKWYLSTVAQNTLSVDGKTQEYYYSNPKTTAHAEQVIFAPADVMGMQRSWTDSVYSGVTMDRAVFMTTDYFADIFGAFSQAPHKYDLAWHIRGDVSSGLKFDPFSFPAPLGDGYDVLTNLRHAAVPDQPWSMTFTRDNHIARLQAAGASDAQVIVGDGGLFHDVVVRGSSPTDPTAPTVLERRETSSTVYGNALDYSDSKDGFVKGVEQEGGLDAGYGLLKVQTVKGTDLCFAAYRPGTYTAGGMETDSQQAFVEMDGAKVQALYLGGGKSLKLPGAEIERDEPGLAYVEQLQNGAYMVGNSSPTDATVTVNIPALAGMKAYYLKATGERGETAGAAKSDGSFSVALKANAKVELVSAL